MDDLMFNLEDMNIKEESLSFISEDDNIQPAASAQTEEKKETQDEINPEGTTENNKVEDEKLKEETDAKETSQEDAPSSDDNSSQNSTLYALAQYLKEEGVLFHDDELKDIKGLEDLKDLIKNSNERARYANLNESQKRYQEALENGVPKSEFEKVEKEIQTFTNIKEEDIIQNQNLRYEIMAIDFMNQGLEQNKAMKLAKLSLADETNVQDAKEALNNILENKKTKFNSLLETSKKGHDLKVEDVKKHVFSKEQLLDQKLNDMTKNKLFDMITTKVDSDEEGRPLNELQKWQRDNPVESSVMLNYLFMMTDRGKNLSLINKTATSTATKELERKLQSMSFGSDGSLIIPDDMVRGGNTSDNKNNNNKNNYTINI